MSASRKATATTAATEAPSWVDGEPEDQHDNLDSLTVTRSDDQQVATVVDATVVDDKTVAMRRAADYVLARGYQAATADIIGYIATNAVDTNDLNVVILEQMATRLLNATSPDDVLDPFGTLKGQDMIGKSLEVVAVTFLESDVPDGFPWYVSFQCRDASSGGNVPVTVGGEKLVLQAAALDMHDAWPMVLVIRKAAKATKAGFYPLELGRP